MKIVFSFLLMINLFFVNAQSKTKFEAGSFIVENSISEEVKKAKTILFVFNGEFDRQPPKSDVEKYLKKYFKNTNYKVAFTYWNLRKNKFTKPELKTADFDIACLLSFENLNPTCSNISKIS